MASRPNDINLNYGVSKKQGELTFYVMSADTLSSFDRQSALDGGKLHGATLVDEITVKTLTLAEVFQSYATGKVDFMSVDAEGYDLIVLKSNDWTKFRPYAVLIEVCLNDLEIVRFMEEQGYLLIYYNHTNGIFIDPLAETTR
jgi:FkbM family methyltransferase